MIYTLYQTYDSDKQIVQFAKDKQLAAVTMSTTRVNEDLVSSLHKLGIPSYVHTVNDPKEILKLKRMGVYGFYTDFLSENDAWRADFLYLLSL
ncbi:Glycerophosphoryl diester phosphodiesterase family protein [compost metagenome]